MGSIQFLAQWLVRQEHGSAPEVSGKRNKEAETNQILWFQQQFLK
jgi:hypothetical protein